MSHRHQREECLSPNLIFSLLDLSPVATAFQTGGMATREEYLAPIMSMSRHDDASVGTTRPYPWTRVEADHAFLVCNEKLAACRCTLLDELTQHSEEAIHRLNKLLPCQFLPSWLGHNLFIIFKTLNSLSHSSLKSSQLASSSSATKGLSE